MCRRHSDIAAAAVASPLSVADLGKVRAAQKRDGAARRYSDVAGTVMGIGVSAIADGGIAVCTRSARERDVVTRVDGNVAAVRPHDKRAAIADLGIAIRTV